MYQLRTVNQQQLTALTHTPPIIAWEYKIDSFSDGLFDIEMQSQGRYGWELVFARRAVDSETDRSIYECIFKRPKGTVSDVALQVESELKD
jgi:hypothetical protein